MKEKYDAHHLLTLVLCSVYGASALSRRLVHTQLLYAQLAVYTCTVCLSLTMASAHMTGQSVKKK